MNTPNNQIKMPFFTEESKKALQKKKQIKRECDKEYYVKNRDSILRNKKKYYIDNRDARLEYAEEYRAENGQLIAERRKFHKRKRTTKCTTVHVEFNIFHWVLRLWRMIIDRCTHIMRALT